VNIYETHPITHHREQLRSLMNVAELSVVILLMPGIQFLKLLKLWVIELNLTKFLHNVQK